MTKFRKKPVIIEAMQFDGTAASASKICQWANDPKCFDDPTVSYIVTDGDSITAEDMIIDTLEGPMRASVGDWIIRGVAGEFYPCKPDIFAKTYDSIND